MGELDLHMGSQKRYVDSGFWTEGRQRLSAAVMQRIKKEVSEEYSTQLKSRGPVGRFFLKRRMNREINKRIRQQAPPDAYY